MPVAVPVPEDFWVPLVDEPIGSIVDDLLTGDPEIGRLVQSPQRILGFKTFAYIRVGLLLGELLVEDDAADAATETWVERLLENPQHRVRLADEVRRVAEEIAADPRYAEDEPLGPDEEARARFREFARSKLESA